jgi:hypothetical protein
MSCRWVALHLEVAGQWEGGRERCRWVMLSCSQHWRSLFTLVEVDDGNRRKLTVASLVVPQATRLVHRLVRDKTVVRLEDDGIVIMVIYLARILQDHFAGKIIQCGGALG